MNNFNTFFISSTINAAENNKQDYDKNVITSDQRFYQTLDTINSIRFKDSSAKIVLVDNSVKPLSLEQVSTLNNMCDIYVSYPHNLFSVFCNTTEYFHKSVGEMLLTEQFIKTIKEHNLVGRRIFKINGRYRLTDSFDIDAYNNPDYVGKYVYKTVSWWFRDLNDNVYYKDFLETKFWSYCGSLIDEYESIIPEIFKKIIVDKENIEVSHKLLIPKSKAIEVARLHLEGVHPNGTYSSV